MQDQIKRHFMKNYYGGGISYFRSKKKVKQADLAETLGMSRQNLSEIENNRRKLSHEKMTIAANALATTPEEIEIKSGIGYVFNNQNQQGEQYNNCTVTIPESLLTTLQQSLSTLQEAIKLYSEQNSDLLKSNKLLREREESLMKELEKLKHRVS